MAATPEQIAKLDEIRKRMRADGLDAETTARRAQQFGLPITELERSYYLELMSVIKANP